MYHNIRGVYYVVHIVFALEAAKRMSSDDIWFIFLLKDLFHRTFVDVCEKTRMCLLSSFLKHPNTIPTTRANLIMPYIYDQILVLGQSLLLCLYHLQIHVI